MIILLHCCTTEGKSRKSLIALASLSYLVVKVASSSNYTLKFFSCVGVATLSILIQLLCEYRISILSDTEKILSNSPRTEKESNVGRRVEIKSLQTLRFLASMHIVMFHFFQSSTFSNWGGSELTFFFLLSGFVLAYQYRGREDQIVTWSFFAKRFVRLYPTYLLSIAIQCVQLGTIVSKRQLIIMILSMQTWIADSFENEINTPAWAIGSFLLCYAIFPTSIRILKTLQSKKNSQMSFLVLFMFSAWQALNAMGYRITIYSSPLAVLFQAHLPSFLFGVVRSVFERYYEYNTHS